MLEIKEKLKDNHLIRNPFFGKVEYILSKHEIGESLKDYYVMMLTPVYPQFFIFGYLLMFGAFVWRGFTLSWLMLPGLILASIGFFWSKYFFYPLFLKGLRRKAYKGKVKLISNTELIELFLYKLYK